MCSSLTVVSCSSAVNHIGYRAGPLTSPTATGGIQGALAQMEVNAAAAMARFKSFRNASGNVAKDDHPPHKDAPAGTPSSQRSEDLQDSPRYPRSASAPPPEAEAGVYWLISVLAQQKSHSLSSKDGQAMNDRFMLFVKSLKQDPRLLTLSSYPRQTPGSLATSCCLIH